MPEIMFHLVGEQAIPVFLAAIQFPKTVKHYLLTTDSEKTGKTVATICKTLEHKGFSAKSVSLGNEANATSFAAMNDKIKTVLQNTNPECRPCAFNITGGTKPMSISAVLVARSLTPQPDLFYLNFYSRELLWLDGKTDPLQKKMFLEDFVRLAGLQLKTPEKTMVEPSGKFLDFLLNNAYILQNCQQNFAILAQKYDEKLFNEAYKKLEEGFHKKNKLETWQTFWKEYLSSAGEKGISKTEKARFLGGIWFEYYVFKNLKKSPGITEILHSAELTDHENAVRQEIDVVYTDGFSLVILECKAGRIKQEHIQKLENLRNVYSGAMGRGGVVCINKSQMNKLVSSRITDSKNSAAFCGNAGLVSLQNFLFNFKPGKINF